MDLWLALLIVVILCVSVVAAFFFGYETGYQAENSVIEGIVDKHLATIISQVVKE